MKYTSTDVANVLHQQAVILAEKGYDILRLAKEWLTMYYDRELEVDLLSRALSLIEQARHKEREAKAYAPDGDTKQMIMESIRTHNLTILELQEKISKKPVHIICFVKNFGVSL